MWTSNDPLNMRFMYSVRVYCMLVRDTCILIRDTACKSFYRRLYMTALYLILLNVDLWGLICRKMRIGPWTRLVEPICLSFVRTVEVGRFPKGPVEWKSFLLIPGCGADLGWIYVWILLLAKCISIRLYSSDMRWVQFHTFYPYMCEFKFMYFVLTSSGHHIVKKICVDFLSWSSCFWILLGLCTLNTSCLWKKIHPYVQNVGSYRCFVFSIWGLGAYNIKWYRISR